LNRQKRKDYAAFKAQAKPIGSGAVESCVRRVVNLRFKGNGIFWKENTAEGLLHMRAQLLSGHWDSYMGIFAQNREKYGKALESFNGNDLSSTFA